MSVEFSSTAPAAPAGNTLGHWQYDAGTGKASVYLPNAPVTSVAGRGGDVTLSSSDISGLVASATTDTTNAANITSGTLNAARLPAIPESQVTNLTTDLAAKAPIDSPTFTGTAAAPTPTAGDNSTKLATTAYVQGALSSAGGGTVTSVSIAALPSWLSGSVATATTTPAITLSASGAIPVANGGTGQSTFPLVIGFVMTTGATGTNVGPELLAPHPGVITAFKVRVQKSDASTALTFRVKQNGTSIFSSDQTITAGTAAGTTVNLTSALTSASIAVSTDDVFTIDVTAGNASWAFTTQARG